MQRSVRRNTYLRFLSLTYDFYRCTLVSNAVAAQRSQANSPPDAHRRGSRYPGRSLAPGTGHSARSTRRPRQGFRLQHHPEADAAHDRKGTVGAHRALSLPCLRVRRASGPYAGTHRGRPVETGLRWIGQGTDHGRTGCAAYIFGGLGGNSPDDRRPRQKETRLQMSAIHLLSAQPWVERLGSTLLHFLWQGILIAVLYAASRKWLARSSGPKVHYVLACAALALMAAAPVVPWNLLLPPAPVPVSASFLKPLSAAALPAPSPAPASLPGEMYRAVPASLLP